MNYRILLFALPVVILVVLAAAIVLPRGLRQDNYLLPQVALSTSTHVPVSDNAFSSSGTSSETVSQQPTYQGKPVTSLNDVAQIIAVATSSVKTSASVAAKATSTLQVASAIHPTAPAPAPVVQLLALPTILDSEIKIDASGVSTALDYLVYFNAHFKDVSFNVKQFDGVLKNKNGTILFVSDLIKKALADKNFAEIRDSLVVQRNFADADIAYMKSIKVTGAAVALNKQAIGVEGLTQNLIDKALAVGAGTLSKTDFLVYYSALTATAQSANQKLSGQVNALSMAVNENWLADIFNVFSTKVFAQNINAPFGGMVIVIIPCGCELGDWVIVGPPVPASLFVPWIFMATPFFFPFKVEFEGTWWLGLYDQEIEVPCLTLPFCESIGIGNDIIMTGTSE